MYSLLKLSHFLILPLPSFGECVAEHFGPYGFQNVTDLFGEMPIEVRSLRHNRM